MSHRRSPLRGCLLLSAASLLLLARRTAAADRDCSASFQKKFFEDHQACEADFAYVCTLLPRLPRPTAACSPVCICLRIQRVP